MTVTDQLVYVTLAACAVAGIAVYGWYLEHHQGSGTDSPYTLDSVKVTFDYGDEQYALVTPEYDGYDMLGSYVRFFVDDEEAGVSRVVRIVHERKVEELDLEWEKND
jgi:hypothetical protein